MTSSNRTEYLECSHIKIYILVSQEYQLRADDFECSDLEEFQTRADNTLRIGRTLSYEKLYIPSSLTGNNLGIYKGTLNMTEIYKERL